jgi:uncharacterized membrane protein
MLASLQSDREKFMATVENVAPGTATRSAVQRYWEIDGLRGVAIIMMVIFHLMWDLWAFRVLPDLVLYAGFWMYFQRTTASLFIILVGVSLTLSYHRVLAARGPDGLYWKFFRRGAMIFGLGMVITIVLRTLGLLGFHIGHIEFGILHLIGFCIAAAYPFLRLKWINLFLWMAFFTAGHYIQNLHVDTTWLVWLGLTPLRYAPVDFFPLIPWFGVVLLGVFLGNTLYPDGYRGFALPDLSHSLPIRSLNYLGRHSLLIYLIHQPVLFAILALIGIISF